MGRRGPAPTPRKIKLLKGTFRRDRAPTKIPEPPKGAKAPSWLNTAAKVEWTRMAPWLEDQGLLTKADVAAFATYCDLYATVQEYRRLCRKVGASVSIREGYRNVLMKAITAMKQYLALFGLSPADRERIGVDPTGGGAPDSQRDRVEDFLFGHSNKRQA